MMDYISKTQNVEYILDANCHDQEQDFHTTVCKDLTITEKAADRLA